MKLSISNIGWQEKDDVAVYQLMKKYGYTGLEIAPTRIFPEAPYDAIREAGLWSKNLKKEYGFCVPSMQSIWYGRKERIFGEEKERCILKDYTRKAIDFAESVGCKNLVFGCPRNRNISNGADEKIAIDFFRELGDYAAVHGTAIGMEANPPIYNTNYMNDTLSALQLVKKVGSKGFLLNLDVGAMIENKEDVSEVVVGNVGLINHVHISEPGLKLIEKRELHKKLKAVLEDEHYNGYISIEIGKTENLKILEKIMAYVKSVFDE